MFVCFGTDFDLFAQLGKKKTDPSPLTSLLHTEGHRTGLIN